MLSWDKRERGLWGGGLIAKRHTLRESPAPHTRKSPATNDHPAAYEPANRPPQPRHTKPSPHQWEKRYSDELRGREMTIVELPQKSTMQKRKGKRGTRRRRERGHFQNSTLISIGGSGWRAARVGRSVDECACTFGVHAVFSPAQNRRHHHQPERHHWPHGKGKKTGREGK